MQRDDFEGSISLASLDDSAGTSAWGAPVAVLPVSDIYANPNPNNPNHIVFTSNDADGYTPPRTAAFLGGGTVGRVPAFQHLEDCVPAKPLNGGETIITDLNARPDVNHPIRVRHYIPVVWDMTSGLTPFIVERRRIEACDPGQCFSSSTNGCAGTVECWVDVSCAFTQAPDTDPLNNNTVVVLTPIPTMEQPLRPLQRGFEYRVRPRVEGGVTVLRSDVPHKTTADDPGVSLENPLTFKVCISAAVGDANDDGVVNFADMTSVLANWCTSICPCLMYGDADRDGDADFADITAVLTNFNVVHPCAPGGQSLGGEGDGFATMDLEPEMSAASAAMAIGDALALMGYASIEAFSEAIAAMDEESRNAEVRRLGGLLEGTE